MSKKQDKIEIETESGEFWNAEKRPRSTRWTIYHPSGSYERSGTRAEIRRDMMLAIKTIAEKEKRLNEQAQAEQTESKAEEQEVEPGPLVSCLD